MIPKHILVPLDFSAPSKQALDYAVELAGKLQARLTFIHVIQPPVFAVGPGMDMGSAYAELLAQIETDASRRMQDYVQHGREAGLDCEAVVVHGSPYQQIIDLASTRPLDLIIMGTHGHTGLPHVLLGSVAEKVVRLAPCPVLVTRSAEEQGT